MTVLFNDGKAFVVSFDDYSDLVRRLTEDTYSKYRRSINPGDKQRGNGDDDYHLDHILSVRECYDRGILPMLCANPENLQFLPPKDNMSKHNSTPNIVPLIFSGDF